jgi:hypothetical protein
MSCYDRVMKLVLAMMLLAACSGPKPRPESPIVDEGSAVPVSCCCKAIPIASPDNKPNYDMMNRMECSRLQGDCVPDVQCRKTAEPQ